MGYGPMALHGSWPLLVTISHHSSLLDSIGSPCERVFPFIKPLYFGVPPKKDTHMTVRITDPLSPFVQRASSSSESNGTWAVVQVGRLVMDPPGRLWGGAIPSRALCDGLAVDGCEIHFAPRKEAMISHGLWLFTVEWHHSRLS